VILIDGAQGEGGGQILRSALTLSLCTQTPFQLHSIRAGRKRPGLMRQHLTAVRAAAEISGARVEGDAIGSMEIVFHPAPVRPGDYTFAVGTAGSTMLVLQTLLLPLLLAEGESTVCLQGGTHNPFAPPFDFVAQCFLPRLRSMGAEVDVELVRAGFYPAGGGEVRARLGACPALEGFDWLERAPVKARLARALVSQLDPEIAQRELSVVERKLGLSGDELRVETVKDSPGPGNIVHVHFETEESVHIFTGFGERQRRAEAVAQMAVDAARRFLATDVPVGSRLADQLLLPLALAGGGLFRTLRPTEHTKTNARIVSKFVPVDIVLEDEAEDVCRVTVRPRA